MPMMLSGKVSPQVGADALQQLLGAVLQVIAARHENAVGRRLDAHHVAVLPNFDAGDLLDGEVLEQRVVGANLRPGPLLHRGHQLRALRAKLIALGPRRQQLIGRRLQLPARGAPARR